MHILICCDTFKNSLASGEISSLISQNLLKKFPKTQIVEISMADGGEGSLDALSALKAYKKVQHSGLDALLNPVDTAFLMSEDLNHAVIELAQTCGLELIDSSLRDCLQTSTYGMGLQIKHAIEIGARSIDLLIGGSATNDLGIGMAAGLGFKFYNGEKLIKNPRGEDLLNITKIDSTEAIVDGIKFRVICDVENILLGDQGAARTYAKQKGASEIGIQILEDGAKNIINILQSKNEHNLHLLKGSGAAGGVGWGAMFFLDAKFVSGIEYMIDALEIESAMEDADLVITGEGKMDQQTKNGKLVKGLGMLAKKNNKKIIAICAINELSTQETTAMGIDYVYAMYSTAPEEISKTDTLSKLNEMCDLIAKEQLLK